MRYKIATVNKNTNEKVTDEKFLMEEAGMADYCGFEDIGMQGDGTPIVFDKCGNFGYLDANKYEIRISLSTE